MLAIMFGCKRFYQYVYGRRFTVETDHRPIFFIMKKPLAAVPVKLLLQLHWYDIDIVHKGSKDIPVADVLSRKCLNDTYPELSGSMDALVQSVMSSIPINDTRLDETRAIMSADPQSLKLKLTIMNGWLDNERDCSPLVKEFWNFRDELSVDLIHVVKGNRIFVPKGQRQIMLERIHTGHMGVTKCIKSACDILFCPKMSSDIGEMVLMCNTSLEKRNANPKEPLMPHEVAERPWQVVATDLLRLDGQKFVTCTVADYYSVYFEVYPLRNTLGTTNKCRIIP